MAAQQGSEHELDDVPGELQRYELIVIGSPVQINASITSARDSLSYVRSIHL